jgi:methionyl-tRNA formyltransferase
MGGKQVGYSSLLFLLEQSEKLNAEVVAVFENSNSPLSNKEHSLQILADQFNIPQYSDKSHLIQIPNVDFIFSVQYNQILTPEEIEVAKLLAVNLHMAPLPEYRGCNQFSFALIDKAEEFGTTLHVLEPGTDAGAIIFEKRFKIRENEFVTDLYNRTLGFSILLFQEKLEAMLNRDFQLTPQPELFDERGTSFHFRNEIEQLKRINASWPLEKQKRYFRATFFPAFEPPVLVSEEGEKQLSLDWYNQLK